MRKATFEVPAEVMTEFTQELVSRELTNCLVGVNEDDEIVIEVEYEKEEAKQVDELEEVLENLIGQLEDE